MAVNQQKIARAAAFYVALGDLPALYDDTIRLARGRDPQAKLAAMHMTCWILLNLDCLGYVTLYYFSPLDDNLFAYETAYDERGRYAQPKATGAGLLLDWYEEHPASITFGSPSPVPEPPDFRGSAALREPWSKSYAIEQLAYNMWSESGKPSRYWFDITMSARVPYDVLAWLSDGVLANEGGKTLAVGMNRGLDLYMHRGDYKK